MIGEQEFALMVSEDIKNRADQMTKDLLRSPDNRERWKRILIKIIKNVETRLDGLNKEAISLRNTYPDFEADPAASIAQVIEKSERFKFHAEKKLAEVDSMLFLENDDPDSKLSSF